MLVYALLAAAQAAPAPPPTTGRNLTRLISSDDYPVVALRNLEEGTVLVTLAIDKAGQVSGCRIAESSGFVSLDQATCRILSERARFSPARDPQGRAVPDTFTQHIAWRISAETYNRPLDAARRAWMRCLVGAARPLLRKTRSDAAVADRSFRRCTREEAQLLALAPPAPEARSTASAAARKAIRPALLEMIAQDR